MARPDPVMNVGGRRRPRAALLLLGAALAGLGGCVVVPARYHDAPPPRAVYVEPAYPSPGPGWVWMAHPAYGWGWHHPHRGWHRGWRD